MAMPTLVWPFSSMNAFVGDHVGTLDKTFPTITTRMMFQVKMNLLVSIFSSNRRKFFATH